MPIASMMLSPLAGKAVIITAAAPTIGDLNTYNTTTAGTDLTITLPSLTAPGRTVGTITGLKLSANDASGHSLIVNCTGGDTFADGSASMTLAEPGVFRLLQTIQVPTGSGPFYWEIIGGYDNLDHAAVQTIVNKTVGTNSASPSTITVNTDSYDVFRISALANALAISWSGSPADEQPLKICIIDNGTTRALSWDATLFGNMGVVGLPAFTQPGRKMSMQFFYDQVYSRFILSAVDTVGYVY